jgi:hypothetical protein
MKPILWLSALAVLAAPLASEAQPWRGHGRPAHGGEGREGEGAEGGRVALFISPCGEPFRAAAGGAYPVGVWFNGADANHDGALDKPEFRADADRFFKVLDRDGDGVVAGPEITYYETVLVPEILGMFRADAGTAQLILAQLSDDTPMTRDPMGGRIQGGGGRKGPIVDMEGAAAFTFLQEPEPVSASDGNIDRRITAPEFAAAADRRFRLLDADKNDRLTLTELPATAAERRAEAGRGKKGRPT